MREVTLDPRARQEAEILALSQPRRLVGRSRVAVDRGGVQTGDRAGILREDTWGLWSDHPFHAETVLRGPPDNRRRCHRQRLLDAVAADPQRDRGLEVRLAARRADGRHTRHRTDHRPAGNLHHREAAGRPEHGGATGRCRPPTRPVTPASGTAAVQRARSSSRTAGSTSSSTAGTSAPPSGGADANNRTTDAVAMTRQEDLLGHHGSTMADQALATDMLGDIDGATVRLEQLSNRPGAASPRVAVNLARIQAWQQAITAETAAAIETAVDGAHAAEADLRAAAAKLRVGDARRAVSLRRSSREQTDEPAWTLRGFSDLPASNRRERQIADLAAEGHRNQRIADRLSLSIHTVENHLATVDAKLGISGRPELEVARSA